MRFRKMVVNLCRRAWYSSPLPSRLPLSLIICTLVLFVMATVPLGAYAQGEGVAGEDNLPRYWQIHAFLLTAGTILYVGAYLSLWLKMLGKLESVGVKVPLAKQIARLWYRSHRNLATLGGIMVAGGLVWGYLMVQWAYSGPHLRVSHSVLGLAAGFLAFLPLLTGVVTRSIRKGKVVVRWWHIALGFVGIAMMIIGLSSGWALE